MESHSELVVSGHVKMLPPPPGTFKEREELIKHARDFGAGQGYVVTIKKSKRDSRVILGCDRGGVYRNRRKDDEIKRKRKSSSKLINCPFEALGRKTDLGWILSIKNGDHNHEPLRDMSEHPYSRRFTEEEVRQIKVMTDAGVKPRQVLKALQQTNPELHSTPRHLYNLKAKIRQGKFTEESIKPSWIPNRSVLASCGEYIKRNNKPLKVRNLIGGKFVESQGSAIIDVINPATLEVVSLVPLTTYEEFKDAVSAAKQAFPSWKNTPIVTRQRIMFKLQELIRRDIDKLAMNITIEQGKALKSARSDVLHGLEFVEHACGVATLQQGEFVPSASNGIDTCYSKVPLGVCAGICPFDFPATISLWMFPIAVACGNTFVLKTSEKNPGASMILGAIAKEAGLPNGVLNIIHGNDDTTNYICDDEDIKAVSFFGSATAGINVYTRAAARGKRVQSNIAGKNFAIVMPDASMEATINALVTSGFGGAGQCMAPSTAIFVGGSLLWEHELVERAKALKVSIGTDSSVDLGPVISKEIKDRISRLVDSSVNAGARLLLDGRNIVVQGYEHGHFVGPTILCDVTSNMECCKEEIFGPVLICMQAETLDDAIAIVNKSRSVNGVSLFTSLGYAARKVQNEIDCGLVGINVPVPIPHGPKASFAGDLNSCGKSGVQFYTQMKMVAQRWGDVPTLGASSGLQLSSDTDMNSRGLSSALRDSASQRMSPSTSPTSESNNSPGRRALTQATATSERDPPSERIYMPMTSQNNNSNTDNSSANPSASERIYMTPASNHAFQRTECTYFSPSERIFMERHGSSSQRAAFQPPSERVYMPPAPAASSASQGADGTPSTSENMYISPIMPRSSGIASSERLYMPQATSQRMYNQNNQVLPMDDYPGQGPSSNLPSSQRI